MYLSKLEGLLIKITLGSNSEARGDSFDNIDKKGY